MDAIFALKTRRSVRRFRPDPIPEAIIRDIVDCGRLAATGCNVQPWEFVVVRQGTLRHRIAQATDAGRFIAQAPVCIILLCHDTKYFLEDGSAATQNLLLAAHAHGLGACWVAGDKKGYAAEVLRWVGAPEGMKLMSLVAMGYTNGEGPSAPKRQLDEVLHWEKFGQRGSGSPAESA
jgi:nitroreductase